MSQLGRLGDLVWSAASYRADVRLGDNGAAGTLVTARGIGGAPFVERSDHRCQPDDRIRVRHRVGFRGYKRGVLGLATEDRDLEVRLARLDPADGVAGRLGDQCGIADDPMSDGIAGPQILAEVSRPLELVHRLPADLTPNRLQP